MGKTSVLCLLACLVLPLAVAVLPAPAHAQQDCPPEEDLLKQALEAQTREIPDRFIACFPYSDNRILVAERLREIEEEEAWATAVRRHTLESYQEYLELYATGVHAEEARRAIAELSSFAIYGGYELDGDETASPSVDGLAACVAECRRVDACDTCGPDAACKAYTFLRDQKSCKLFRSVTSRRPNRQASSGSLRRNVPIKEAALPQMEPPSPTPQQPVPQQPQPLPQQPLRPAQPEFVTEYGKDYPGGDLAMYRDLSEQDCRGACSADKNCNAFTYNIGARACFLKHTVTRRIDFAGAVSGYRSDGGQPAPSAPAQPALTPPGPRITVLTDVDLSNRYRPGNDYHIEYGITLNQCAEYCQNDNECRAFTYNPKYRKACILKRAFRERLRYNGAYSGIKE